MHNTAQKAQLLGDIVAIATNIGLRRFCISGKKIAHVPRLVKYVFGT
jgi:hypothetical protein